MTWTASVALAWVARGIALAVLIQTLELWLIRSRFSDIGIWRWPILRPEHAALPPLLRCPLAALLPYRPFLTLLASRAACAAWMLVAGAQALWLAPVLLVTQVAICVRFRGTFNGGSDYMTVLILLALSAATSPRLAHAALAYVAVQTTLSYCIAGLVKLKEPAWRDGRAVRTFLELAVQRHGAPPFILELPSTHRRCQLLAITLIGFECSFPLAWLDPRVCAVFLLAGLGFHFANNVVFGLNRFWFAWAAAYPAVYFCSQWLGSSA